MLTSPSSSNGRPRRQAAIAGAARLSRVREEYLASSDEDGNRREEEDTIVCRETKEAKTITPMKPKQLADDTVEEDGTDEDIHNVHDGDDDNDEDFEVSHEEIDDDSDEVFDGSVSETEDIRGKKQRWSKVKKNGIRQTLRIKAGFCGPVSVETGYEITKAILQNMPTKSPTLDERSNVPAKETKPNSSSPHPTHPIVSEISPDDKTGSDAPVEGSQQPDHEMADGPSTQVEHTGNATFKTEVDNPNLIIPMRDGCAPPGQGSDDDEPLLANSRKRHPVQTVDSKKKHSRGVGKTRHTTNGNSNIGFGGPSETKFRRKEISAMLQIITKDIKWKDVQRAVGNERRTAGSYASHWKNVLLKNILERYQE